MTRPVSEWQWTSDPAIFWLRMEHLPPSRADLVKETFPPPERPLARHRSIRARDLKAIREEAANAAYVLNAPRRQNGYRQTRATATAATITEQSTAAAERMLGIDHDSRRTA